MDIKDPELREFLLKTIDKINKGDKFTSKKVREIFDVYSKYVIKLHDQIDDLERDLGKHVILTDIINRFIGHIDSNKCIPEVLTLILNELRTKIIYFGRREDE